MLINNVLQWPFAFAIAFASVVCRILFITWFSSRKAVVGTTNKSPAAAVSRGKMVSPAVKIGERQKEPRPGIYNKLSTTLCSCSRGCQVYIDWEVV